MPNWDNIETADQRSWLCHRKAWKLANTNAYLSLTRQIVAQAWGLKCLFLQPSMVGVRFAASDPRSLHRLVERELGGDTMRGARGLMIIVELDRPSLDARQNGPLAGAPSTATPGDSSCARIPCNGNRLATYSITNLCLRKRGPSRAAGRRGQTTCKPP